MLSRRIKLRKIDCWWRTAVLLERAQDDGGRMFQRALIAASLALGLLAMTPAAAGQSQKIFRVGYLDGSPPAAGNPRGAELRRGLREHGYVEGQNLVIEYRWTGGRNEGFPALAAELVRLKADVIVAHASPAVRAAKEATKTIPIVLLNVADPVGEDSSPVSGIRVATSPGSATRAPTSPESCWSWRKKPCLV